MRTELCTPEPDCGQDQNRWPGPNEADLGYDGRSISAREITVQLELTEFTDKQSKPALEPGEAAMWTTRGKNLVTE